MGGEKNLTDHSRKGCESEKNLAEKKREESEEDAVKTMATWRERGYSRKLWEERERDTDDELVLVRVKESYNCLFNLFIF